MKQDPLQMHKMLPANMSLSALIKSVKEILLFAINSMQFAEFILHFWIPFHILTQHVKYEKQSM